MLTTILQLLEQIAATVRKPTHLKFAVRVVNRGSRRAISGHKNGEPRTAGRPKGSIHFATKAKQVIDAAFKGAADCGEDGEGKGKLAGYMKWLAYKHPEIFVLILLKVLPDSVAAMVEQHFKDEWRSWLE